jgi:hypothetical protein
VTAGAGDEVAQAPAEAGAVAEARAPAAAPARSGLAPALRLVAPLALGAGVPLALFALWLWLAPLFSAPHPPARLVISAPPGTTVALDGRLLGGLPPAGLELEPGVYALRAVLPGGRVVERRVVVWPRGATLTLP